MKIDPSSLSDVQAQAARAVREAVKGPRRDTSSAARPTPSAPQDTVELSAEGRALGRASSLTDARVQQIRQRIMQGAYDSLDVVDTVARQILQRGDV
ncbi:MAG: hypothetical protein HYX65_03570 [Gemmatimonadetes bacterium]|nr:hypothetical protein [Gemmatimonadota bacterium]